MFKKLQNKKKQPEFLYLYVEATDLKVSHVDFTSLTKLNASNGLL